MVAVPGSRAEVLLKVYEISILPSKAIYIAIKAPVDVGPLRRRGKVSWRIRPRKSKLTTTYSNSIRARLRFGTLPEER